MGRRLENRFKKRFGDEVTLVYPEKPLKGPERCLQNEKIFRAFTSVLAGILKREPTANEVWGEEDISKKRKKA